MLDWEENIFLGLKALYRQVFVRPEEKRRESIRATLKERRPSLLLLGEMIAARPLSIFETSNPVLCERDRICLPAEFATGNHREANAGLYELKTIVAALAIRDGWQQNGIPLFQLVAGCRD